MRIFYKRYDAKKNDVEQVIINNVDHIQCHIRYLYYWLKNQPKWMFRINFDEVSDVRIKDETN